jgi:hypothetical protein
MTNNIELIFWHEDLSYTASHTEYRENNVTAVCSWAQQLMWHLKTTQKCIIYGHWTKRSSKKYLNVLKFSWAPRNLSRGHQVSPRCDCWEPRSHCVVTLLRNCITPITEIDAMIAISNGPHGVRALSIRQQLVHMFCPHSGRQNRNSFICICSSTYWQLSWAQLPPLLCCQHQDLTWNYVIKIPNIFRYIVS